MLFQISYINAVNAKILILVTIFVDVRCDHAGAFFFLESGCDGLFYHGVQIFAVHLSFIIKFYAFVHRIFPLRLDVWSLYLDP